MEKEEFVEELNMYVERVYYINDLYYAYDSLIKSIDKYNQEINLAPGFFSICLHAIYNSLLLELSKMYSFKNVEKNIYKLINVIKSNQQLFKNKNIKNIINNSKNFLESNNKIINYLKDMRNKILAHNDPKYFNLSKKSFLDFNIELIEMKKLIDFHSEFINSLLLNLDENEELFKSLNSDDLPNLLSKVK